MKTVCPLSPEETAWLIRITPRVAAKPAKPSEPAIIVFTEAEIDWLWPRFQQCRHRAMSFAKHFAKTARDKLTPRGKACLADVAFPYRRQIFAGADKWTLADFIQAVRTQGKWATNKEERGA